MGKPTVQNTIKDSNGKLEKEFEVEHYYKVLELS